MSFYNSTVPSSPPRDIQVESHNPVSLNVSWRSPVLGHCNGPITGYMIIYTQDGSSDMMSVSASEISGTTVITISGLVAYVSYSVIMAAMTVNGTGPFSDPPVVGRSGEDGESRHTSKLHEVV